MGLDQYLELHSYLGTKDDKLIDTINKRFGIIGDAQKVVLEIGYWRKAYEIQEWFGKNCDFIDNGSEVIVTFEQLLKLKEWCKKKRIEIDILQKENQKFKEEVLTLTLSDELKKLKNNNNPIYDNIDYGITQLNHTISIINKIIKFETCNKIDNKISTFYYKYTANW